MLSLGALSGGTQPMSAGSPLGRLDRDGGGSKEDGDHGLCLAQVVVPLEERVSRFTKALTLLARNREFDCACGECVPIGLDERLASRLDRQPGSTIGRRDDGDAITER